MENTSTDLAPATPPSVEGSIVSRVELPSGGWAELRDPTQLRARDKKRVLKQIQDVNLLIAAGLDVVDGLTLMLVEKWEIPYLPGLAAPIDKPDSLDDLTIPDYDALVEAVGPAQAVLFPAPATIDGAGKPGSPTPPANA